MLANSTPRTVLTPFGTFPSSSFRRRNAAAWNPRNSSLIKNTMQTHCQIVCFHTKHEATFVVYFIWSNVYCSVFRSTSVTPTGEDHIRVWASDWRSTWDCTKKNTACFKMSPNHVIVVCYSYRVLRWWALCAKNVISSFLSLRVWFMSFGFPFISFQRAFISFYVSFMSLYFSFMSFHFFSFCIRVLSISLSCCIHVPFIVHSCIPFPVHLGKTWIENDVDVQSQLQVSVLSMLFCQAMLKNRRHLGCPFPSWDDCQRLCASAYEIWPYEHTTRRT